MASSASRSGDGAVTKADPAVCSASTSAACWRRHAASSAACRASAVAWLTAPSAAAAHPLASNSSGSTKARAVLRAAVISSRLWRAKLAFPAIPSTPGRSVSSENDQLPFPARTCRSQRAAVLTSPGAWATAPHMVLVINSPGPGDPGSARGTAARPARLGRSGRRGVDPAPMTIRWRLPGETISNASARTSIRRTLSASPSSRPSAPQLAVRPHVASAPLWRPHRRRCSRHRRAPHRGSRE